MAQQYFKTTVGVSTPAISFVNTANSNLQVRYLDSNTLSFSSSSGQLFSVTDSMTGTIFAVNDISGIPSIEVDDTGVIRLAETFGNVLIGTAVDNGAKLNVQGTVYANNFTTTGAISANGSIGTSGQTLRSDGSKAFWSNEVGYTGSQGNIGYTGSQGLGVPLGGNAGQILVKSNSADNATSWIYNQLRSISNSEVLTSSDSIILASGNVTLTLPSAIAIDGKTITIKNVGTGEITVNCSSAQLIDSYANLILGEIHTALEVVSTGSSWAII